MILGWREQAGFMAMRGLPTEIQVKTIRAVFNSPNGIEAVVEKHLGLECVVHGWLNHIEHRRDDGGVVDVWSLTPQGRVIIVSRAGEIQPSALVEAA